MKKIAKGMKLPHTPKSKSLTAEELKNKTKLTQPQVKGREPKPMKKGK